MTYRYIGYINHNQVTVSRVFALRISVDMKFLRILYPILSSSNQNVLFVARVHTIFSEYHLIGNSDPRLFYGVFEVVLLKILQKRILKTRQNY